ncbi:hypothetical protein QUF64_11460 [Anaerolineales bacterium HSG6]|nr:hypothetical protein [Anaerolineales bacterium HSG6]
MNNTRSHHNELMINTLYQSDQLPKHWLQAVSLEFDPFQWLDAATDPHLNDYIVEHQAFDKLHGQSHAFVFAPSGGGKTALRVRATQYSWIGQQTNLPFPLVYLPPYLSWKHISPSIDDHLTALSAAGATQLFLLLIQRPQLFLEPLNDFESLDELRRRQKRTLQILHWNFPGDLTYQLEQLQESFDLTTIVTELEPTYRLPDDPPTTNRLHKLCQQFVSLLPVNDKLPNINTRWFAFIDLLLDQYKFPAVHILLDGLDVAPETGRDPNLAVAGLAPILSALSVWEEKQIFLKAFLPLRTELVCQTQYPTLITKNNSVPIHWDERSLRLIAETRLETASQGAFNSLAGIAIPGFNNIETVLINAIASKLPRELLALIRICLIECIERGGPEVRLTDADVNQGINRYRKIKQINEVHR